MGAIYQQAYKFLDAVQNEVFVEIGSDRLEGSTLYLAELAKKYNTILHSVDITAEPQTRITHSSIQWHVEIGSVWSNKIWPTIGKKIQLLYLDNFDYNWNIKNHDSIQTVWDKNYYDNIKGPDWPNFVEFKFLPLWIKNEICQQHNMSEELASTNIQSVYAKHNLTVNNNNCQIEHFKQLLYIFPWLSESCVVVFDDTYVFNDCWIGKNGPGVIFLQANGFEIVEKDNGSVILKKFKK